MNYLERMEISQGKGGLHEEFTGHFFSYRPMFHQVIEQVSSLGIFQQNQMLATFGLMAVKLHYVRMGNALVVFNLSLDYA